MTALSTDPSAEQFIHWLQPLAKKEGVEFDFYTFQKESTDITFQKKELKNYSSSRSQNFVLRVVRGKKYGASYTKDLEKSSVEDCFREAVKALRISDKEERGDMASSSEYPAIPLMYQPALGGLSLKDKIQKATRLNTSALAVDSRIQPVYNQVIDQTLFAQYGNKDHRGQYKTGIVCADSYILAVDKEKRGEGFSNRSARVYADIDFEALGKESAIRALEKLSVSIPKTGEYPVVFHASQPAPVLLEFLAGHINGKAVYEKLSLLDKKLNKKVFAPFNLYDDPFAAWGFNTMPFDAEGFPAQKTVLVKEGVLENYLTSSFFARALGVPHTAKASWTEDGRLITAPSNIVMEGGDSSLKELLKTFPRGIMIDNLKGLAGYNSTSGDFSIESEGFLWEGGELKPLCQFAVSGNIIDVFAQILKIADDSTIYHGQIKAPSFLVPKLSIAGK